MTEISTGLKAGLSKLFGSDAAANKDHETYAHLIADLNIDSLESGTDAAALDTEELVDIYFAVLDASQTATGAEADYLKQVLQSIADMIGITPDQMTTLETEADGLNREGKHELFLDVAGQALSIIGSGDVLADEDAAEVGQKIDELIDEEEESQQTSAYSTFKTNHANTTTQAHADNIYNKSFQDQKFTLLSLANESADTGAGSLETAFAALNGDPAIDYEEQITLLLTGLAEDLAKGTFDSDLDDEKFQSIFNAAISVLPDGASQSDFLEDIAGLVGEKDSYDTTLIDSEAGEKLVGAAFTFADENGDIIDRDVRQKLYDASETAQENSGNATDGESELDDFLMDHFDTYDRDDIISSEDNILTSSARSDIDDLVNNLIAQDMADGENIVKLMGLFPSGTGKSQGELVEILLSELPEDALDDVMPFLLGQVLVLEQKGDMDEDDIEDMFENLSSCGNADYIEEYFEDMGLDIDDLEDGDIVDEMLENEEFREAVMEEWETMMRDESEETDTLIGQQVDLVLGIEEDDETSDSSGDDSTSSSSSSSSSSSTTTSSPVQEDLAQRMQELQQEMMELGMGSGMGMGGMDMFGMGMGDMGMGGMGMMSPMPPLMGVGAGSGAYGFGYAQAVTDTIMGGGAMGGGINITGDNNVVNVNVGNVGAPVGMPAPPPPPPPPATTTTTDSSDD